MEWLGYAAAVVIVPAVAVDAARNPGSWRELGLMIQDSCRYIWFYPNTVQLWATKLRRAYRHKPRHSTDPGFMSAWHLL